MELRVMQNTLWRDVTVVPAEQSKENKTLTSKPTFSHMQRQLETGGGIRDTGDHSGEETTVVTQVMSDGSVLTTVYEGKRIVSQNKTHAANTEKIPTIFSTQVEKSGKAVEGTEENLACAETESLMLNMLKSR